MFDYLIGKVTDQEMKSPQLFGSFSLEVGLQNGAIAYQVFATQQTFNTLAAASNQLAKVYIYHHVSETEQTLYGFENKHCRNFFLLLIKVSGIGPKMGLKILSLRTVPELTQAIQNNNLELLKSVKGLGAKTAARLVLELKPKLPKGEVVVDIGSVAANDISTGNSLIDQTKIALKRLEFSEVEIKKVIQDIFNQKRENQPTTLEQAIKNALVKLQT